MAVQNYTVWKDFEGSAISVTPGATQTVVAADSIRITHDASSGGIGSVTVSGWNSAHFDTTTSVVLTKGSFIERPFKASPTLSQSFITVSASGFTSGSCSYSISSPLDTTPTQFFLPSDKINQPLSQYSYLGTITVLGVNTSVSANITNGEILHNGLWGTSGLFTVNQTVSVRVLMPGTYNTSVTCTLTIGASPSTSDSITLTTIPTVIPDTVIDFPDTLPFSLLDVAAFYGTNAAPITLRDYYKNDDLVPNISANSGVPSSGAISLLDFVGSGSAFYFITEPKAKSDFINTSPNNPGTASVQWLIGTGVDAGWHVGFGAGMNTISAARMTITVDSGTANNVTVLPVGADVFSAGATFFSISVPVGGNTELTWTGTATLYVRHPIITSNIISRTISWQLGSFGP